jgi:glycosyltransferase involved in cell wall biosynthesis
MHVAVLHNIIAPYKTLLFNELHIKYPNFRVLYIAEIEGIRKWKVNKETMQFPYDIMFEKKIDNVSHIKAAIETYKRLNLYNPEIIIISGYNYLFCWSALIWAKRKKKKVIVIVESHYLDKPRNKIKEGIKKLFISNCDGILAAGSRHKDYIVELGAKSENIFIMGGVGGVDRVLYDRMMLEKKKNKSQLCNELGFPSRKYFIFVGRFSSEKNILFLLEAYERLKNKIGEDWGLILVGDGPQRREIDNFIFKHKIKDIVLPGFIQSEELPLFYAVSEIFILPSISEPWGLVVNEAMNAGLPVLVSNRCGCYPDIVKDGVNGFSFDPFEMEDLHMLMKNVAEGKYDLKKMGEASLDIIKDYTSEKTAEIVVDAINFVLKEI